MRNPRFFFFSISGEIKKLFLRRTSRNTFFKYMPESIKCEKVMFSYMQKNLGIENKLSLMILVCAKALFQIEFNVECLVT